MSRKFLVPIQLPANPTQPLEAATKQYVDALVGDVRCRWTRSSIAYPGANANIDFDAQVFASAGAPTESGGQFTVVTEGLYTIEWAITWGASSAAAIIASWLSVSNVEGANVRYSTDQVVPGNNVTGWVTNGSATLRFRVGDTFRVQVYTPSGAPAGISAAEINVAKVG